MKVIYIHVFIRSSNIWLSYIHRCNWKGQALKTSAKQLSFFNLLKEIALFVKQLSLLHFLDVKSFIVVMIYIVTFLKFSALLGSRLDRFLKEAFKAILEHNYKLHLVSLISLIFKHFLLTGERSKRNVTIWYETAFVLPYLICLENLCHPLNQSDAKTKPNSWSFAFPALICC